MLNVTQPIGDWDSIYTHPICGQKEIMLVRYSSIYLMIFSHQEVLMPSFDLCHLAVFNPNLPVLQSCNLFFPLKKQGVGRDARITCKAPYFFRLIAIQLKASRKSHFPGTFPNLPFSKEKKINLSPRAKLEHLQYRQP